MAHILPSQNESHESISTTKGEHTSLSHGQPNAPDSDTSRVGKDYPNKRNILLVGTSGRGKSSIGNIIFDEDVFQTSNSIESDPDTIVCKSNKVNDLELTICDALTIQDKRMSKSEAKVDIQARLAKCNRKCGDKFHFIIFVFSCTSRITPEMSVADEILEKYFRKEFFTENAICVFTHGEDFDLQRDFCNGPDFNTWCHNTQDPLLRKFVSRKMKQLLIYKKSTGKNVNARTEILEAIRNSLKSVTEGHDDGTFSDRKESDKKRGATVRSFKKGKCTDTPDCDLEIFLIGKTGHGKSATGNTILGEKNKFKTSNIQESATLSTDAGWTTRDGMTVKVVDGPGLLDTRLKTEAEQLNQMQKNLSEGFLHCPNGFHALVLVLSYCNRFTDEEKKTVAVLKGMLGEDFISDHCIIVFTHGENFLMDEPQGNFEAWCSKQTGDLEKLLNECKNRVVLFHNLRPEQWDESTKKLISLAQKLGERYTAEMFHKIAAARSKFIEEHGAIQLKGLIQSKINMIISCLKKEEKGALLNTLVNELEEEVLKVKEKPFHHDTVGDIKKGIQQTRNKEYQKARETFETIELRGKLFLQKFLKIVETIVMDYLVPAWNLAKRLYKFFTGF